MAFDQTTRNRLARFVGDARALLSQEFTRQLQLDYGLDPATGEVGDADLAHLDDARRETARLLRETAEHYLPGFASRPTKERREVLDRIVREQAFTVLNRLCALRMAEARGLLLESVGHGHQSKGFQLYARVVGPALGETGEAYRAYLFSVYDELAVDLPVLFDRFSPQGRLFPREAALLTLLDALRHPEVDPLWAEDETIGWIYQYFNSKEERQAMRDPKQGGSQAPRNSRELAVRNQFFTPRYVVEFLTDNTLGRTWYEMTRGQTALADSCRYLVRRPREVFLFGPDDRRMFQGRRPAWTDAVRRGDFSMMPETATIEELSDVALAIDGYAICEQLYQAEFEQLLQPLVQTAEATGQYPDDALNCWLMLFAIQRTALRHGQHGPDIEREAQAIYQALRDRLQRQRDDLAQEELLKQGVFLPHRPLKDPRAILMLDPACGSMHFGLYAFDLFERIYDEAWDIEEARGPEALERSPADQPLTTTYPDKASFLRDVPRLIVERNIHGVDIDSRAVQIAGLSLWLRAQKSWKEQGVHPQARPQIRRSNVVCAEPMPGDKHLLEEFITRQLSTTPEDRVVAAMLRRVFDAMRLAGEAGSLLKIEEEISSIVAEGKRQWQSGPRYQQAGLFDDPAPAARGADLDRAGITDAGFWERAEGRIYAALDTYASQAEHGEGYRRRLFAHDAAQGFAFIDLCRKRYDVVLMNPPFGTVPVQGKEFIENIYPLSKHDLACTFVERWSDSLVSKGILGAITTRTPFFLEYLSKWRETVIIDQAQVRLFADLGDGVLEAIVETCAYTITKSKQQDRSVFFRLSYVQDKESALLNKINSIVDDSIYLVRVDSFKLIAGSPFCYWKSDAVRGVFNDGVSIEHNDCVLGHGAATTDNERFLRLVFEVPESAIGAHAEWINISKGGPYSPFVTNFDLLIRWKDDGAELKSYASSLRESKGWSGHWTAVLNSYEYYFRQGITWPSRPHTRGSFAVLPGGMIFTHSGMALLGPQTSLLPRLAILNSRIYLGLLNLMMPRGSDGTQGMKYELGYIRKVPMPSAIVEEEVATKLSFMTNSIISTMQSRFMHRETTNLFVSPHIFNRSEGLSQRTSTITENELDIIKKIADLMDKSDEYITTLYNIPSSDAADLISDVPNYQRMAELEISANTVTKDILSWLFGLPFGRWDVRYATGERQPPELPDPFAPLPVCPPGMLQNARGLPAEPQDVPAGYPLRISWSGIVVDDEGHPEDVEARAREAVQVIWGERAEAIEQEAIEILGVKSLREYLRKPALFFADHLGRYSKSRRQAPIYWPLSTPSSGYTLWLYYHRLTDQTLYSCVNDYVEPKLRQVAEQADGLRRKAGRSGKEEKDLERLSELERELRDFRDELLRVAAFWRPNLNDGVQITAAPLWRLFQHKPWQKKLRETWANLEAGEYDWAHLAYSVWPERVRAKCKTDRSLAIAHDLEQLYVAPPASAAKKRGKAKQTEEPEELIDAD